MKKDELMLLSKKELVKEIIIQEIRIIKLRSFTNKKQVMLKHFEIRIKKIRDSIDYLLQHPYSKDTSILTRKHRRDHNQPSKFLDKKMI